MNPLTREWVEKAEGDYVTAERERRARKTPNFAVQFRYPGQSASKTDAREAFEAAKVVRTFIRSRLGL